MASAPPSPPPPPYESAKEVGLPPGARESNVFKVGKDSAEDFKQTILQLSSTLDKLFTDLRELTEKVDKLAGVAQNPHFTSGKGSFQKAQDDIKEKVAAFGKIPQDDEKSAKPINANEPKSKSVAEYLDTCIKNLKKASEEMRRHLDALTELQDKWLDGLNRSTMQSLKKLEDLTKLLRTIGPGKSWLAELRKWLTN